jgi:hypothetical protein
MKGLFDGGIQGVFGGIFRITKHPQGLAGNAFGECAVEREEHPLMNLFGDAEVVNELPWVFAIDLGGGIPADLMNLAFHGDAMAEGVQSGFSLFDPVAKDGKTTKGEEAGQHGSPTAAEDEHECHEHSRAEDDGADDAGDVLGKDYPKGKSIGNGTRSGWRWRTDLHAWDGGHRTAAGVATVFPVLVMDATPAAGDHVEKDDGD